MHSAGIKPVTFPPDRRDALLAELPANVFRSGFKTPSNVRWLCCRPLQNAPILQCMLRFFIGLRLALEHDLKF
jgi:hypothetical protein